MKEIDIGKLLKIVRKIKEFNKFQIPEIDIPIVEILVVADGEEERLMDMFGDAIKNIIDLNKEVYTKQDNSSEEV